MRHRTNFVIRSKMLELAAELGGKGPTAVVDHGANPGLVSHFVKAALLNLDRDLRTGEAAPGSREEWAQLAHELGIVTIQVSERDTQASRRPKTQGEFVNTWSVAGCIDELMQPAELAWGTAERWKLKGAHEHRPGSATYYLKRPGASTFARSWVPSIEGFQGMLVTHDEVFSIADYLSLYDEQGFSYRPTVMFVYHPCDDAMLSALELEGNGWLPQRNHRLVRDDIVSGIDELGVLLAGHKRNAYWYGSQLSIERARSLLPGANATIIQVVAGAMAAIMWTLANPERGVVEAEALDHEACLAVALPYLGEMAAVYTDWTPLDGRGKYFPEKLDVNHPWQMQNILSRQWLS